MALQFSMATFNHSYCSLADRSFGDYVTLAALPQRGVDVVARLSGARKVDFRKAVKLIRCLIAKAVAKAGVLMTRVGFKGTVDAVRNYSAEMRAARSKAKRETGRLPGSRKRHPLRPPG